MCWGNFRHKHALHLVFSIYSLLISLYVVFMFSNDGFSHLHLFQPDKLSARVDNDSFICLALSINLKL